MTCSYIVQHGFYRGNASRYITYDGSSGEELGNPSGRKNLHGKGGTEDNSRVLTSLYNYVLRLTSQSGAGEELDSVRPETS